MAPCASVSCPDGLAPLGKHGRHHGACPCHIGLVLCKCCELMLIIDRGATQSGPPQSAIGADWFRPASCLPEGELLLQALRM